MEQDSENEDRTRKQKGTGNWELCLVQVFTTGGTETMSLG